MLANYDDTFELFSKEMVPYVMTYGILTRPGIGGGRGIFGGGIGAEFPFGGGFPESIAIASSPWSKVHWSP